jgi:signal transduction histidine kinase
LNFAQDTSPLPVGSFSWNITNGRIYWSPEIFRIYEYDSDTVPTLDLIQKRLHPFDIKSFEEQLQRITNEAGPVAFENRLLMPDDRIKHIQVSGRTVKTAAGEVEFFGAVLDLSHVKDASNAFEQTVQELKEIAKQSDFLAQGQFDALSRTIDALARETIPDKAMGEVLRTVVDCLRASGACVWLIDKGTGLMNFSYLFEAGVLKSIMAPEYRTIGSTLAVGDAFPWPELFESKKPVVMDDIRIWPDFPWRDRLVEQGIITVVVIPMLVAGIVEGVVNIQFADKRTCLPGELNLAQALANQAMMAIQLCRLSDASRKAATLAERNRLARDFHDTIAESFTGVIMQLEAADGALARHSTERAKEHLDRASLAARRGLEDTRRSLRALRPLSLRDARLPMAMESMLKRATTGTDVIAEVRVEGERRLIPEDWEESLLRIAQEAMTNTIKHAKARNFRATLVIGTARVELRLADDGRGFEPGVETEGLGLVGMRERVLQLGGQFTLRTQLRGGTEIVVALNRPSPLPIDHGHGQG